MAVAVVSLIFPSGQEWIIILIVGIVLFGRRLPEVGKQVGRTIIQLRQGMQKLRDDIDLDTDLREVKETMTDVEYDLRESASVDMEIDEDTKTIARGARDPQRMLENLTNEALSSPGPEEAETAEEVKDVSPSEGSLFVKEAEEEEGKKEGR